MSRNETLPASGRETVNSQGYSELREPNKNARKLLFTDLVNTKIDYLLPFQPQDLSTWGRTSLPSNMEPLVNIFFYMYDN